MKLYLLTILTLLYFNALAQTSTEKLVVKELETLRGKYKSLDNFSVEINYRLFNGKDALAIEELAAKLTKKGTSQLLESNKHITLSTEKRVLTINHEQKVVMIQDANLNKVVDPLSLDVSVILDMAIDYQKLENLKKGQLGYRFSFYDNQYKSIDIIYNSSTYFLEQTVLILNAERGKIQIDYKNLKQGLALPSAFFSTDKYFIERLNKIELTNTYASYELYN